MNVTAYTLSSRQRNAVTGQRVTKSDGPKSMRNSYLLVSLFEFSDHVVYGLLLFFRSEDFDFTLLVHHCERSVGRPTFTTQPTDVVNFNPQKRLTNRGRRTHVRVFRRDSEFPKHVATDLNILSPSTPRLSTSRQSSVPCSVFTRDSVAFPTTLSPFSPVTTDDSMSPRLCSCYQISVLCNKQHYYYISIRYFVTQLLRYWVLSTTSKPK